MSKKYLDSVHKLLSRRRALQGMGALLGAAAIGCADDGTGTGDEAGTGTDTDTGGSESAGDEVGTTGGTDTGEGTGSSTGTDTGEGTDTGTGTDEGTDTGTDTGMNDACAGPGLPIDQALAKVEHIIVLCMENRSFDHYFGARQLIEGQSDIEGLTGEESNPDGMGEDVFVAELDNFEPKDPPHQWDEVHAQWNDGALDGFVTEQIAIHGPDIKHEVMGYHVREDLPVLWALADNYTLCDHWHCSQLGGTWVNRYYLHCGTSNGQKQNVPAFPYPTTIQEVCGDAGISNNNYYGDVPWRWGAFPLLGFGGTDSFDEFFQRVDDGTLEEVVIIDPSFTSNDDHPSHNIMLGQALIATIYQALAQSEYWDKCLFVITYDEHGGFYDHVAPGTTPDATGPEWQRQGFRVPSVVIGPHVRSGCVDHTVLDHASVPATITRKYGLAELNERTAGVNDLANCIDPNKLDDPAPPAPLPKVVIDVKEVMAQVGVESSQEELMRATGKWPITPEFTAAERERILRLLKRGQRLGALDLRNMP